jgi:cytochrome c oxidase subunit 2
MWNFPLFPEQASTTAAHVDALVLFEVGVILFFTFLVLVLVLGLGIHYRRGHKVDRSNPPGHNNLIEAVWIVVPLAISAVMFLWATQVFFELYSPPPDAVEVKVVGKQWMWKLQHPEGKKEINELHVPLGQAVKLDMISQDVIHSFFIPAFRTKQDVLPGRHTELWFRPEKVGVYHLFCAEYCGTDHSVMGGYVYVMEPSDYERWLHEGETTSMARQGEDLFVQYHCAGCHGASQTVKAPRLEGVYGKKVPIMGDDGQVRFVQADERYIRDSILLPKSQVVAGYEPIMPSFEGRISEEDLYKIMEYIKSIGSRAAPAETLADARAMEQARRDADTPPETPAARAGGPGRPNGGEGQQR